ncbi:MAG: exodeoxyribonuclease VII small subunit [Clostridia bacterium]|nr:exodeoxyribonuclease VII small subunit [Clostridia bacterium]
MDQELTYESAEKELNEIISKIENEKISLSEANKFYERGAELVKYCLTQLEEVKGKITIIKKDLDNFIEEKFKPNT